MTLADGDTNPILTRNTNTEFQGNCDKENESTWWTTLELFVVIQYGHILLCLPLLARGHDKAKANHQLEHSQTSRREGPT